MAIGAIWNVFRIDWLSLLSGDLCHRDDPLHRPYVRQLRRAQHDVADGVNAGFSGLHPAIRLDKATVRLDLGLF